ncbi:polysaccharide deacetylase family protein [Microbacterium sp. SORGH_AS_0888]|uniref:polysaccharide deacetylase family protein n=1 Tax=Microbacterium sp. SORGH_AS_0888 TaxID=3041791 RepID=UPI00277DC8EC|nr:polysaccharide deacetylase family protein [Microbacterium sp. SORGH_AS_0888]MDQ1131255.1 peptidoglycan/xylan/chitin deacetylase (PgdA/CDA1 family) [Microbacterium sp. SORGH_AS_0888]
MRRRLTAAAVVAVVALLAGCAPAVDRSWTPSTWPEASVSIVETPGTLDPADVGGLSGQRIRNDAVGVQARWTRLPGDAPINARLSQLVRDAITARSAAARVAYGPAVFPQGTGMGDRSCQRGSTLRPATQVLADPAFGPAGGVGTAVVCDVVVAAGTFFGERIRVVTGSSRAVTSDVATTLFTNTATGEVVTGDALWTDAAPLVLWDDLVEAIRRDHGSLSLATVQPPGDATISAVRAALAQAEVIPGRSLAVTLPPGFTAPELTALGVPPTAEPTTMAVPADTAAAITTPFGAALAAAAAVPFKPPAPAFAGFTSVDCTLVPCVAMTYDDGPSEYTAGILDTVAAHHASVTFFSMGQKAAPYAAVAKRALAEGNLVENHTWDHPHLTTLSAAQVARQIRDTTAAYLSATGQAPTVFRPPYGQYNAAVLAAAGMPAILWDVDGFDWQGPADDVLVSRVVDQPQPGSIVLQHDIQPVTARTVDRVYTALADRGFTLVNIRQLFGGRLPSSGVWKSGR